MKIYDCDINCSGEIVPVDNEIGIEFTWELWFDVEDFFGISLRENEWVNMYTTITRDGNVTVHVFVDSDTSTTEIAWEPNDDEMCFLRERMEDYCYHLYKKGADDILAEMADEFNEDNICAMLRYNLGKCISSDYVSDIYDAIRDDVVQDVIECSAISCGGGFSDADILLAIGRVLKNKLCK